MSSDSKKKGALSKLKVDKSKLVELSTHDIGQVAGGAGANSGAMGGIVKGIGNPPPPPPPTPPGSTKKPQAAGPSPCIK